MRQARVAATSVRLAMAALGIVVFCAVANLHIIKLIKGYSVGDDASSSSSSSVPARMRRQADVVEQLARSGELCQPPLGTPYAAAYAESRAASTPSVMVLNDQTLALSSCLYRPWASGNNVRGDPIPKSASASAPRPPPPYKVLLTNFGWNHPDPSVGINVTRTNRTREFVTGVVNHPYFDPTDWDDVQRRVEEAAAGKDVSSSHGDETRYYVFLDVETCLESNYPIYGGGFGRNMDSVGGRVAAEDRMTWDCNGATKCPAVRRVIDSPLFQLHPNTTMLVYLDCWGYFMSREQRRQLASPQFAIAVYSAGIDQIDPSADQGLPPPAVTKILLTPQQTDDIISCAAEANRPYYLTFVGSVRNKARAELLKLHNPDHGVFSVDLNDMRNRSLPANVSFTDLLLRSVYAAAPAGDNLFSYRFTEIMASGAIPVVHSDGWVLPFRPELVDWSECLLHLPEASIPETIEILQNVTVEQRCRMRTKCMEIYRQYMADGDGTIRGLLDGLELVKAVGEEEAALAWVRHPPPRPRN